VGGVTPNSGAAKAGLQEGDVIVELNGKKVPDPRNLRLLVAQAGPNAKVSLRVLRGEPGTKPVEKTLSVTLGELPQEFVAARGKNAPEEGGQQGADALDGVEVTDLDAAARRQLNIPRTVQGALVVNVDPDSEAARSGLTQGDVILEMNRQRVRRADDAVALSQKAKGDPLLLRVWTRIGNGPGGTHYLVVENSKGN
jgi:serine protease Do